jgi:membrane protease YdiL (CAAX protease family)
MNMVISLSKQYSLALFCILTIALTFAATLLPMPGEMTPVVIVFIPALMAITLTALSEGKAGVRSLLGKLSQRRVKFKWVVITVALAFVMRLTISLIALGLGMIPAIHLRPGSPAQVVILAFILFLFAIPEELGWRGYALSKLIPQHSPLTTSLIVGILWGSLHLALHLPGMIYAGLPLLPTLLQLIGLSVLITWLYMQTDGNILLTSLFHAAQSFFVIVNEGIPLAKLVWLMSAVYLAIAFIIVIIAGYSFVKRPVAAILPTVESALTNQAAVGK